MDLTSTHPRSPYDQLDGLPWLPRMIDKARAHAAGTLGEYSYPCGMDRATLDFYGIAPDTFLQLVQREPTDQGIAAYVRTHMSPRSPEEIAVFRNGLLFLPPRDDEPCALLEQLCQELAPGGRAITTFAEAIAVDEGWPIPKAVPASHPQA